MAESAGQGAADLTGDAERAAILFRDIDAFDFGAAILCVRRIEPDQPFPRPVAGDLLGGDLRPRQREPLLSRPRKTLLTFSMSSKDETP